MGWQSFVYQCCSIIRSRRSRYHQLHYVVANDDDDDRMPPTRDVCSLCLWGRFRRRRILECRWSEWRRGRFMHSDLGILRRQFAIFFPDSEADTGTVAGAHADPVPSANRSAFARPKSRPDAAALFQPKSRPDEFAHAPPDAPSDISPVATTVSGTVIAADTASDSCSDDKPESCAVNAADATPYVRPLVSSLFGTVIAADIATYDTSDARANPTSYSRSYVKAVAPADTATDCGTDALALRPPVSNTHRKAYGGSESCSLPYANGDSNGNSDIQLRCRAVAGRKIWVRGLRGWQVCQQSNEALAHRMHGLSSRFYLAKKGFAVYELPRREDGHKWSIL